MFSILKNIPVQVFVLVVVRSSAFKDRGACPAGLDVIPSKGSSVRVPLESREPICEETHTTKLVARAHGYGELIDLFSLSESSSLMTLTVMAVSDTV